MKSQWHVEDMLGKARRFRAIDAHSHVGSWTHFTPISLDERIGVMNHLGIAVALISSMRAVAGDIVAGNNEVLEAMRRYPGRLLGYVHVSANYPELIETELARCCADPGVCGIKVYQNGIPYSDPSFTPAWEYASAHALPVLAHTWAGNLTGLDAVAAAHPSVPFLVGHAGSALSYTACIGAAKRVPNLYLDLTYSRDHPGMIELFVAQLGAERIIWGSDEPVFAMTHQMAKVLSARISAEEKETILARTAMKLFKRLKTG